MANTSVLIVGGGPAGLTLSLLLSRLGVPHILVDRRPDTSNHPRGRLYDICTLELFRQFGVQAEIEETGAGRHWTEYNRWFENLSRPEIAHVHTASFHSVPTAKSPTMPVMSSQDYVEDILLRRARSFDVADIRFHTEAGNIVQEADGCRASIRDLDTGETTEVSADYIVAADGVNSSIREQIGLPMGGDPIDVHMQDVLFNADLSEWFTGNEGGVVLVAHKMGGGGFQPIDGKTRYRAQIANFPRDREITDAYCIDWIKSALGTDKDVDIEIQSVRPWQYIAGMARGFRKGRTILAGDAAHAFIPTGGLGSNAGLQGVRNLAWKLAFVLKGVSPDSLLDTYFEEHGTLAATRIEQSLKISRLNAPLLSAHFAGRDTTVRRENRRACASDWPAMEQSFASLREQHRPFGGHRRDKRRRSGQPGQHFKRVEKPLGQLSRPASAGRETGCTASRSLRAVHRWQRRCAKRPENVPPRKRPGDREESGGVCKLRSGQGARLAGKVNGSEWLINVVTRDKRK